MNKHENHNNHQNHKNHNDDGTNAPLDQDDTICLETSGCSTELIPDGGNWPDDLPALGAVMLNAADRAIAAARAAQATNSHAPLAKAVPHINILLSSNENIARLNLEFRGKDQPTNVLSFPVGDDSAFGPAADEMIGDIVLGHETIVAEAKSQGLDFEHHIAHLIVHGTLHLLGYDHQDDGEAVEMEKLETQILSTMNIANPYAADLVDPVDPEDPKVDQASQTHHMQEIHKPHKQQSGEG